MRFQTILDWWKFLYLYNGKPCADFENHEQVLLYVLLYVSLNKIYTFDKR